MRIIDANPKQVNKKDFVRRTALETDCKELINEDCLVRVGGKNRILYVHLTDIDTTPVRWAAHTTKIRGANGRTGGLQSQSQVFGFMPRRTLIADFCHNASMALVQPKQHMIFVDFAKNIEHYYRQYFPDTIDAHYKIVEEKIRPEWRLTGTPFTSGIVNKDNPLKYHYDAGNFKGMLSNMIGFKKGMEGGRLCCPEFNLKFEIADNTLLIFDGQSILHGVTPFKQTAPTAYRYTIVYYSLAQMWKCEPVQDEVKRIRTVKKEREHKRIRTYGPTDEKQTKEDGIPS